MRSLRKRKWDTAKYLLSVDGDSIDWEIKDKFKNRLIHFICSYLLNSSEFDLLKGLLNAIPNNKRSAIANQRGTVCLPLIHFALVSVRCVCIAIVFAIVRVSCIAQKWKRTPVITLSRYAKESSVNNEYFLSFFGDAIDISLKKV